MTMCHSYKQAIMYHQDLVRLNSSPFMNIAKVPNPIILNAIPLWYFPVRHLPALLHYILNFYGHFFLKVFIISHLILDISQPFCFRLCSFPTLQISPQNLLLSSAFGTSLGLTLSRLNSAYIFFFFYFV